MADGEKVQAMAMKQEEDGMIFCLVDCIKELYQMNNFDTNDGGYEASDLRKKLNDKILRRFPENVKNIMVQFTNGDFLRIPTEIEICGDIYYGESENPFMTQWKLMKIHRNNLTCGGKNGNPQSYWLQNKIPSPSNLFVCINGDGHVNCNDASDFEGVRLVFKLKNIIKEEKEV